MKQLLRIALCFGLVSGLCANETPPPRQPDMTLMAPMRDGVELPTDVYLPTGKTKNLPCILVRSPSGRRAANVLAQTQLTDHGYVFVVQETRSAMDQEGKTIPYVADSEDGYDTVVWLKEHELTNGKIGTLGASAQGITQLLLAPTAPEGLECQHINVATSSIYHYGIFPGGQLLKNQVEGWLGLYARDPSVRQFVCNKPQFDDFWTALDSSRLAHQVKTPAVHFGGWYDTFLQGTIDAYVFRQETGDEGARGTQKLVIGPWTHFWPYVRTIGDFPVPEAGRESPFDLSPERWFAYYLKGEKNGVESVPPVTYYVMGPLDGSESKGNVWRTAERWPVTSEKTAYYLTADGALTEEEFDVSDALSFTYDPADPAPTLGGRNLFLESGAKDQRPLEEREDVVIFSTEPLEEDLEVTGRVLATVYFSSDQEDTDVSVRLTDVYPDGRSVLIADGHTRLAAVHDEHGGEAVPVEVDLWSTSTVFAKGHRVRLLVTSSNYPRYEKNPNKRTGYPLEEGHEVAQNRIWIGGPTASHITLPIVR